MFYSPQTGGFYDAAFHGDSIPDDAVEITAELHSELMEGQSQGQIITPDKNGFPVLTDPLPPTAEELAAIARANRAAAYRDESDPLFFKWQRGEAAEQEWLDKIAEIKARYP